MKRIHNVVATTVAIAALLLVAPSSEAQVSTKQSAQATKLSAVTKKILMRLPKRTFLKLPRSRTTSSCR